MNFFNFSIENIGFLSLFLATLSNWYVLTKKYKRKEKNLVGQIASVVANICLALTLTLRWVEYKYFPLSNLYESLIFLTWGITLATILLENRIKTKLIGATLSPLSLLTLAFANLSLPYEMQQSTSLVPALKSNWLMMHVSVMMVSYVVLIIGCVTSLLYILVGNKTTGFKKTMNKGDNRLQLNYATNEAWEKVYSSENLKENIELKPKVELLDLLDNTSYRMISLGFPFLTLGLISGAVWANEAWGSYWSWDPKETWALITWLVFATYLHTRINKQWEGKKSAILATVGFIVVWICYLGVNFLGKGLHSYGWIS